MSGHAEAVQITFDPNNVSYEQLVDFFFRMHGMKVLLALDTNSLRSNNSECTRFVLFDFY